MAPLKGTAAGNIEVFINEASASAFKVVVAAEREVLLFASLAALHWFRPSQKANFNK